MPAANSNEPGDGAAAAEEPSAGESPSGDDESPGEEEEIVVGAKEKYFCRRDPRKIVPVYVTPNKTFPLDLGWSLSVEDTQGLTFERRVVVNKMGSAAKAATSEEYYVAISRATSLANVAINMPAEELYNIFVHPRSGLFLKQKLEQAKKSAFYVAETFSGVLRNIRAKSAQFEKDLNSGKIRDCLKVSSMKLLW